MSLNVHNLSYRPLQLHGKALKIKLSLQRVLDDHLGPLVDHAVLAAVHELVLQDEAVADVVADFVFEAAVASEAAREFD